jgi:regulator of replication initiation timing
MRGNQFGNLLFTLFVTTSSLLLSAVPLRGQSDLKPAPTSLQTTERAVDLKALADSIRDLQAEVQTMRSELTDLRAEQQLATAEARELRRELELTRARLADPPSAAVPSQEHASLLGSSSNPSDSAQDQSSSARIARLEENQQLLDAKMNEQSQTKVESGSKYRVRLSGIVLLNLFDDQGTNDNLDFPEIAVPRSPSQSTGAFGGTLRQSQIGLDVFGPDIAGARTSANVKFDFAGGFVGLSNGFSMGVVRLRTSTVRLDWSDTSIIAGQDSLFFAPLYPTSLASLAVPALAYSGNLWNWTPQLRIEHRLQLSDSSRFLLQAGILDSLTGEIPAGFTRYGAAGEQSGQPAYASRVAWTHSLAGHDLTLGFGGYYAAQHPWFGRNVDGWAGTTDLTLPLGNFVTLSGEFYRGQAIGGLNGGIGQSILQTGPFSDPTTRVGGLDSMGGWVQLKVKPTPKVEVNGAFGQDNPFAGELRRFPATQSVYNMLLSRNRTPLVNFIYQPRSDVMFSVEYRRLETFQLFNDENAANQVNMSVGYIF